MKKFNWKTKRFIGGLLTIVLLGYGVANPAIVSQVGAEAICSAVACDA